MVSSEEVFGVLGDDLYPTLPSQSSNRLLECIGTFCPTIEQGDQEIWPIEGDHQAGNTGTGTKVQYGSRHVGDGVDEVPGVVDDLGDLAVPQESEMLGPLENGDQRRLICDHVTLRRGAPANRETSSGRLDDDPAIRVLTDGAGGDTVFVVEHVVDHLAVGGGHRLE